MDCAGKAQRRRRFPNNPIVSLYEEVTLLELRRAAN